MKSRKARIGRRLFLTGAGVTLGLPLLETFLPRRAEAQTAARSPFLILVVNGNGVVQSGRDIVGGTDPEWFWPLKTGALTTASMDADKTTQASGELSAYADRLLMVRGVDHPFPATGCMHASGDLQLLTATKPVGDGNKALASGESIDSLIARQKNPPGREPLVLHAGKYSPGGTGFDIPGYVSYVGVSQPRTYIDSAYKAYQKIIGVVGTTPTTMGSPEAAAAQRRALRSKSVNDILRTQIQGLMGRSDLSSGDSKRLSQHFAAIRDIEVQIGTMTTPIAPPSATSIASMQRIDPKPYDLVEHEAMIRLHMELMAFSAAADYSRVAVLKIGDREDDHLFTLNGTTFVYHTASHRGVPNGAELCHQIDRLHARHFKFLLDKLAGYSTATGPLIDQGVTVWTNQCAAGNHSYKRIPFLIVGTGNGYLKKGQFIDVGSVTTNRMLNTLLGAVGVTKTGGAPIDDFGDASLTKGTISQVLA